MGNKDFSDIKTTAAESPSSNNIVERNSQTLASMMDMIIPDINCSPPELALTWALNTKNRPQNVTGFSPFQLVLAKKLKRPCTLTGQPPALTMKPTSKTIQKNLTAIHTARSAFIASQNDESIKSALTHNIRTTSEVKYFTRDKVLYKRDNSTQL